MDAKPFFLVGLLFLMACKGYSGKINDIEDLTNCYGAADAAAVDVLNQRDQAVTNEVFGQEHWRGEAIKTFEIVASDRSSGMTAAEIIELRVPKSSEITKYGRACSIAFITERKVIWPH
jgi:hypothetical protein